jgi:GTPase SAR1 family protein
VRAVLRVSEVCKWLRTVTNESEVWRNLLEQRWPHIDWQCRLQHTLASIANTNPNPTNDTNTNANIDFNNEASTSRLVNKIKPRSDCQRATASIRRALHSALPSAVRYHSPWKILYVQQLHMSVPVDPLTERRARLLRLYQLQCGMTLQNSTFQYMPVRVAVLGDRGVGKTSLILAFVHDTFVDPTNTAPTLYQSYLSPLHLPTHIRHTTVNAFWPTPPTPAASRAITLHFLEPPGAQFVASTTSPSSSLSSSVSSFQDKQPPLSSMTLSPPTVVEVDPETRWRMLCALKDVDVVLLTFNVADVESFHNVRRFYLPFVRAHCADVPVLLCALQTDRRRLPHSSPVVSEREGRTLGHTLGARSYVEFAVVDSREPDLLDIIIRTLLSTYSSRQRSCTLQ